MAVEKSFFDKLESGETIDKIVLKSSSSEVTLLTLGATIQSWKVANRDIIVGSDSIAIYKKGCGHMGEVVAPYANRIAKGKFTFQGEQYNLDINNGQNNLHSGSANLGAKIWEVTRCESTYDGGCVTFVQNHKHLDGGFLGNIGFEVTYILEGDALTLDYKALSDRDTVVNPTNHAYFNLNKNAEPDIRNHKCFIAASKYVSVDESLIPTAIAEVEGTDFDFRSSTIIGARRNGCYDHCYCFDSTAVDEPKAVVEVEDLALVVYTDLPGMQLYTGDKYKNPQSKIGPVGPHAGLCLETSLYPDVVNHMNDSYWMGKSNPVVKAGETYESFTTYEVVVK
ncbi:MAG: galactose mutarotase [Sphaerochaetaceae bacterium]|nr:galactose mutarotase [Sphaerochaetaceae bacterium]